MNENDERQERIRDAISRFSGDIKRQDDPNEAGEDAMSTAVKPPAQQRGAVGSVNIQLGDVKIKKSKGSGKTPDGGQMRPAMAGVAPAAAVPAPVLLNRRLLMASCICWVVAVVPLYLIDVVPADVGDVLRLIGFAAIAGGAMTFTWAILDDWR